ncbi:sigma-70 family RNA polymerase sigma factor [Kerstersia gyiorum]|uniref:sigma-70 family RNA polymerase sigma factor n=1 Tax=Kerstersia gyiorum TaxID=206506 RepID=UPI00242E19BA|nr:sigma-70 family RNA polymerase sigma factor [Kerstersia gyiorum]MCH4272668.1 sigma-70 family RNA polymerase sigma factor [Kerstersia gyiorum]MCI1230426.1 sigma-70 family RNA polymerase sigma factor [Kerstersia gyiorum]
MSTGSSAQHDALATMYQSHHGWLRTWLQRRLGNTADAADLAQDAFLRLLAADGDAIQAATVREPRAYLKTVAGGLLVNFLRRRTLEQAYMDALASRPENLAPSPEERAMAIETLCELDALLHSLPAKARQAFLLAQLEGMNTMEIAQKLQVSDRMVRKYLVQALAHCAAAEALREYMHG